MGGGLAGYCYECLLNMLVALVNQIGMKGLDLDTTNYVSLP